MGRYNYFKNYLFAFSFWIIAILFALKIGAVEGADLSLIIDLRLPRVILASAIGIGLAISGATLQALFTNPLCEPYTLGISSGATLGSVIGISLGLQFQFAGLTGTAFVGALLFTGILYAISLWQSSKSVTLLLSGVMLGFFGSSLVALWMALSDANGIQNAIFWLMGDLSRARLNGAIFSFFLVLSISIFIYKKSRSLDALLLGEEEALSVGVNVVQTRRNLILLTSLLIGICVSGGGMIGFVGLITPHIARKLVGSLHRALLPLAAIWGAGALTAADALSRFLIRPYELPVGVITALLGVPLFMFILFNQSKAEVHS